MGEQLLPLTEFLRISNCGHILYFYETLEQYVANAVAYVTTGIEYGHHILIVEKDDIYPLIDRELKQIFDDSEYQNYVHYIDSGSFYGIHGDFHYWSIVAYFGKVIQSLFKNNITIRTWAHVQWKEQDNILLKLDEFEQVADKSVSEMELMSVCAYDANAVSASLLTRMLHSHAFYMTDNELVQSPLYGSYKRATFS
ncbi:MEDS domain-containing protein [Alicyclobacillus tolerans]|uniref:MEDS domain-containing protein n=1 Tax=Alicyclobacillus tolerans TaxID=90970 RepID=UPI001F19FEF7|nr:MEDS domain-containing protein [Alicyclobacillus tolerans]MCF8565687.1 MEDS domain-containing protein [Alicyclobacillus tolerans]